MSHIDLEHGHHRSTVSDDISICFSDTDDVGSCYSQFYSTTGGSYDDDHNNSFGGAAAVCVNDSRRISCVSDCSVEIINESDAKVKVHLSKLEREEKEEDDDDDVVVVVERDCRICHLGLESNSHESGIPIELGCSCKDDLAAAHKHCAEVWFKIKGNKTCEICHSVARNVVGANEVESADQLTEGNTASATSATSASVPQSETRSFWQGHRFLNFLLACMVFAFVISWLFHFNVPSS
ncbi:hypothetical protein ACFE04_003584 [Oxalis oulophora]